MISEQLSFSDHFDSDRGQILLPTGLSLLNRVKDILRKDVELPRVEILNGHDLTPLPQIIKQELQGRSNLNGR
jgi:hypothetical protein